MKNFFRNFTTGIAEVAPTFLSAISGVSIALYLLLSYNKMGTWWSLPLTAVIAGLSAITFPTLCRVTKVFNSIIATGWAILFIRLLEPFAVLNMWTLPVLLFIIAMLTEILVHGFDSLHFGEILLDFGLSFIGAKLFLQHFNPAQNVTILVVVYILVIILDFHFSFTFKRKKERGDFDIE